MSDLPDRLRHCAGSTTDAEARLLVEAATEIDDLYVVVRTQIIEIYDLRTLADQLAEELRANHDTSNPTSVECPSCVALTAYEAARKETT